MSTAEPPAKTVWPILTYVDARAGADFLVRAFGFVEKVMVPTEDGTSVVHGELSWPEGGGVMLHSERPDDDTFARPTGIASVYVVTEDPHAVYAAATAVGAVIVREMADEDYGSTGFSAVDPEGNIFSFGTYRGEG